VCPGVSCQRDPARLGARNGSSRVRIYALVRQVWLFACVFAITGESSAFNLKRIDEEV